MRRVVDDAAGVDAPRAKISAQLVDFARPMVDSLGDASVDLRRAAYMVAVIAWNAAIATAEGDGGELERLRRIAEEALPHHLTAWFEPLVERKLAAFASDGRWILRFDLRDGPEGDHLTAIGVASRP